jgi:hypothetical protein
MSMPDGERSRAVLIGTSDFQNPDLPSLPAVDDNLHALFRALTDPGTGILPGRNCQIVQSPDSPDSLMRRLRRSANEAEDLLLVYYAGHGLRHERRDDLYLAVRQTDPAGLDGSAVEFEWVREVIADSPARSRLLILDCCYSGLALDRMSGSGVDARELAVSGTSVLASSPRNKQSHSPSGERHTAFTGELLALLDHGSPFADRPLTVSNAYLSIKAGLARRGFPLPTLRSDDSSGQLLLRRTRMAPVRPVRQPEPPPPPRVPRPLPRPPVPSAMERTAQIEPIREPVVLPAVPLPPTVPPLPVAGPPPPVEMWSPEPEPEKPPTSASPLPRPPLEIVSKAVTVAAPHIQRSVSWGRQSLGGVLRAVAAVMCTFCLGMVIGGLAGFLVGPQETRLKDLNGCAAGIVVLVVLGTLLLVRNRRRHFPLLPAFNRVPMPVLTTVGIVCAAFSVYASIDGPSTARSASASPTSSAVAIDLAMAVTCGLWAVVFGLAVWRRRAAKGQASVADQAVAGDQGEVKGGQ